MKARRHLRRINVEPLVRLTRGETNVSFMKAGYLGIGLSLLLSLASVGLLVAPGLNFNIDFQGGIVVETDNPDPIALDALLREADPGEIRNVGGSDGVLVRVQEAAQTAAVESVRGTVRSLFPDAQVLNAEVVGPNIAGEVARGAVIAVALASLTMMICICARSEWHVALGAIATVVLDATNAVGFSALTGLNLNLTAIPSLLTIIGYSLNDKVVFYDRMRENLRVHPQMPLWRLIDGSINRVFARLRRRPCRRRRNASDHHERAGCTPAAADNTSGSRWSFST